MQARREQWRCAEARLFNGPGLLCSIKPLRRAMMRPRKIGYHPFVTGTGAHRL
jgi:hypothetical protein